MRGLLSSAAVPKRYYMGRKPKGLGKVFIDVGNKPKEKD